MLFVIMAKAKTASTIKERVARRQNWEVPSGLRVGAEYWLLTSEPAMIAAVEADDLGTILTAIADWDDVFDVTVVPAMTAQQGLELAKRMGAGSSS
jgi:hypothetical protein